MATEKLLIIFQVVIITVLIPVAFFFLLRSLGKIDTIMAENPNQRKLPLAVQTVLLYLLIRQSMTAQRVPELHFFFLAALLSTVLALVFVFCKIKVSLHLMGMSAMLLFLIGLSLHNQTNSLSGISVVLVLTGLVASSRLVMNAHTHRELALGFLCGLLPQILLWPFWL